MEEKKQTLREKLIEECLYPFHSDIHGNPRDVNIYLADTLRIIVDHIDDLDREAVRVERKH